MRRILALSCMLSLAAGGAVHGQGAAMSPDTVIATRKSVMDLQNGVMAGLKVAVEAKADVKPLKDAATALSSSSKVIVPLFPTGTETGGDTKAKAEIWSDRATFEKDAAGLQEAADKLVALSDANDKAGFAAQFAEVGKACGACHRQFRQRL